MKVTAEELNAVSALAGPERYRYFVKRVVDREAGFGLWRDGWALAGTDDGREVFPLWPAPEFALACATGDWRGRQVEEVGLDRLLDELLPSLESKGVGVAVFPTPEDRGVVPSLIQLRADLDRESELY